MKYILFIALFACGGCGREKTEYPMFPTNGWYAIGSDADRVPCKKCLTTGVETPLTADELKPCGVEIKLPIYGEPLKEGGAA